MKNLKWYLILINLVALLIYFNYSVLKKEDLLDSGELILFRLAPVDPRSLMQGDYMTLRYDFSDNIDKSKIQKRGYCVLQVDGNNVAKAIRLQPKSTPLHPREKIIKYNSPNEWTTNIGTESYFFEEGKAEKYENAVYGGIVIDTEGNSLLLGLYDDKRQKID
ncbi:GDYXXLXY domain-containing protein [Sphingobacterium rhinopitheci]|uniref:GDYXXLXY domain-containing protein n=1 Tax=Sphingobacterium rhinopitheci TaxID=2781960 RepID=UPI001F51D631|nr:GDYXXLXY domain-containing protein [Sphingobacterium rhinopitheci]MCI0921363.1 GDYXXLXY domain-containing protein [Sphingobacterium rhinopitheci]